MDTSPQWTETTPGGAPLADPAGNVWALGADGVLVNNGNAIPGWGSFTILVAAWPVLYGLSRSGTWYTLDPRNGSSVAYLNGDPRSQAQNPPPPAPTPAPPPAPVPAPTPPAPSPAPPAPAPAPNPVAATTAVLAEIEKTYHPAHGVYIDAYMAALSAGAASEAADALARNAVAAYKAFCAEQPAA